MFNRKRALSPAENLPLSHLQWEMVSQEQLGAGREITQEEEDILSQASMASFSSEITKWTMDWMSRRFFVSEIYTLSTMVAKDFSLVMGSAITMLDENEQVIDVRLATESLSSSLSLFSRSGDDEFLPPVEKVSSLLEQSRRGEVKLLVSPGLMHLSPALVTLHIERRSAGQTALEIRGVSKEGWIHQHAGEKGVHVVVRRLEKQLHA